MSSYQTALQNETYIPGADESAPGAFRAERTDNQLVDLVLAGDGTAFEQIFDRYKRLVAIIANRYFRRPEEVEEIIQISFAKAFSELGAFRGRYHSLGGRISPLDHVAPEDLRIKELLERVAKEKFSEIIFALAADVEGEATTNYIVDLLKDKPVMLTRIAHGLPAGGGLESADELTLYQALSGRTKL